MNIAIRSLPYGDLPYTDLKLAKRMVQKLFPLIPYLPCFPKINPSENIINRTLSNILGVNQKEDAFLICNNYDVLKQVVATMDNALKSVEIDDYGFESVFLEDFLDIIKNTKPKYAVVNFIGAFTISQLIRRDEIPELITDRFGGKFLILISCIRAIWIINKIKQISPTTVPIILYEEPMLNHFGALKRSNDNVNNDQMTYLYSKIIECLHDFGAFVAVQCFSKCDWQMLIDAGIDILSFDAYTNPHNLSIISDKVNDFLAHGGYINWGIIPVKSENMIKNLTIDDIYSKLVSTIDNLIDSGVVAKFAYNHAIVSVQGNLDTQQIMFAEKALMLTGQLGKKIPVFR